MGEAPWIHRRPVDFYWPGNLACYQGEFIGQAISECEGHTDGMLNSLCRVRMRESVGLWTAMLGEAPL